MTKNFFYKECICCSNQERQIISTVGRNFTKLTTVMCLGCGLIHSHPIPSRKELDEFYKLDYRKKYKLTYKPQMRHTIRYAKGCFETVKELFTYLDYDRGNNKTFLDIGSGSGEILYFAKKMGFDVLGIEPNNGYAEFTKIDLNLNVINSTLEKTDFNNQRFDVINLNQVLEHLPNPLETLSKLKDLVNFNGVLILTVPDIESKLHSPNTQFHYAHIYNYNHLTLKKLFDKTGLQILNPQTTSTRIFSKKTNFPDNSMIDFNFKKNFENISKIIYENNYKRHYLSLIPYLRFIRKCYQYPREVLISLLYRKHIDILNMIFIKYRD